MLTALASQERLIARDGELDAIERKARDEGLKTAEKLREVQEILGWI